MSQNPQMEAFDSVLAFEVVMDAVHAERQFQDKKYGPVTGTGGHELAAWLLIIEAELAEAKKAAIHGGFQSPRGRDSIRAEIVQIAAVCFAALEQHGVEESNATDSV